MARMSTGCTLYSDCACCTAADAFTTALLHNTAIVVVVAKFMMVGFTRSDSPDAANMSLAGELVCGSDGWIPTVGNNQCYHRSLSP